MKTLPKKVLIPKRILKDEGEEGIADYLSDEYGFCVNGFNIKRYDNKVYAENIDWDTTE